MSTTLPHIYDRIQISSFSIHFLILKYKISQFQNILACCALIFNIHIFRFKTDAGHQVFIDINTESSFSFSKSSFFLPLCGYSSKPDPWNCFLFYPLGGFRGFSKSYPVSKARAFCVNVNMTATSQNQKWSSCKEVTRCTTYRRVLRRTVLTCCLRLICLYIRQYFIKLFIKKF